MLKHFKLFAAFVAPLTFATALGAEVRVGAGIAMVPQFEGASEYQVRVAPNLSFKGERFSVRTNGPGFEMDLVPSRAFDAGPILRYKFGRDGAKIDNAQVSALPKIEDGLELGAYAQLNVPIGGFSTFVSPRLAVVQGVQGGARGTLSEASLGVLHLKGDWTFGARAAATYANADYMSTQFNVAPASPSGLAAYSARAGIKDVGLSLFASYKVNDTVSLVAGAGYKTLVNDAANSPIVSVAGSKEQMLITLGVSYTFN